MKWRTASSVAASQGNATQVHTRDQLIKAYHNLFSGNGSKSDAEIVLVDLAGASGFYAVLPADCSDGLLREHNAKRGLFGEIFRNLTLSEAEQRALEIAVREQTTKPQ